MSGLLNSVSFSVMQASKYGAVYAMLVFLLLLSLVNIPVLQSGEIRQGFFLIGLYFWTTYRPNLLPYPVVFFFGLVMDLISGGLIGLHAFCFMVLAIIVRGQRRFLLGQSWQMVWAGFFLAVALTQTFQAMAYAIPSSQLPDLKHLTANIVLAGLLYPLFHPIFMAYNRYLSES